MIISCEVNRYTVQRNDPESKIQQLLVGVCRRAEKVQINAILWIAWLGKAFT